MLAARVLLPLSCMVIACAVTLILIPCLSLILARSRCVLL